MVPAAGKRDTLVTFQRRVGTKHPKLGSMSYAWSDLPANPTAWASMMDYLGSERAAEGLNLANRPCSIEILYRDDITGDMRVLAKGRTLQIVRGPIELGRREGLKMVCEDWSTEGDAA
jgi:head-tail adaptor